MRTTVNLAADLAARLRALARDRDTTLSEVVNATLRQGLAGGPPPACAYRLPTQRMGLRPGLDLTHALAAAAALEDEEIARKLELRK